MAHRRRDREYFLTLPLLSAEFARAALERFKTHLSDLKNSHRHERMKRAWCMYYSKDRDGGWDDTEIQAAGPNGETTLIRPNEYRNLLQHQLNLVTQAPPGYECIAVNSDSDSYADAIRGNGILDYYLRVHHLDDVRVERAEIATVMGESHLHARWDHGAGEEYGVDDQPVYEDDGETPQIDKETGEAVTVSTPVYEGEFVFRVNTPYDVAYDPMARDKNRPRWVVICEPENRYDLVAQFPEQEDAILDSEPYSAHVKEIDYCKQEYQHDDYIPVFYVYGEKSPAVRTGREAMVLNEDVVLSDGPLSEDRIPNFRLAPSNVIFQSGGYTNNFDLMPLQEVYSAQMSTILSNHTAFGKQWVTSPKGTNVKPHHLNRGLGLLEYESLPGSAPPQALSLLASQNEHLTFLDVLRSSMERMAVINAAVRGDVDATKGDSGAKAALIHATAQQFASSFHRALSRSDEDVGTHVIASLRTHATTKRVATILGRYSSYSSIEYEGKDLEKIARVTVRAGNAMRDTPQGRELIADKLMTFPDGIVSAEQYITFLETGRTEPLYEGTRDELMHIRRENEDMRDGKPASFSKWDKHSLHIREHKGKLCDEAVRSNPQALAIHEEHLAKHVAALDPTSPGFVGLGALLVIGEKPLPMPQPEGPPTPGVPSENGEPQKAASPNGKPKGPPQPKAAPGMPGMPRGPVNPATGQRANVAPLEPPPITQG